MDRDRLVRVTFGVLLVLGGVGIVVGTATDQDASISAGAAVVCLISGAAIAYSKRTTGS